MTADWIDGGNRPRILLVAASCASMWTARRSRCSTQRAGVRLRRHLHPPGALTAQGRPSAGQVICPGHQWAFDLDDRIEEGQDRCQPTYPVRVEDGHRLRDPAARVGTPSRPQRKPTMTSRTFVAVGAGQTAAVAARTLRREDYDGRIVLIGDEPHAPTSGRRCRRSSSPAGRPRVAAATHRGVAGQATTSRSSPGPR